MGDIAAATARHLLGMAAGLLLIPVLARTLGAEGLGAWTLLGTTGFLLGISDLGLSTCVQRAVAAGDAAATRRLVALAMSIVAVVAPLLALGSFLWLATIVPSHMADARPAAALVMLGGVIAAFGFPLRAFALMHGKLRELALARAAASALQLGATLGILAVHRSLLAPAVGFAAAALVETLWLARAVRRADPELRLRPATRVDWPALRGALREGAATLVVNVSFLVALRVDVLILADFAPLAVLASYAIGARAVDQAYVVAKQVSTGVLPRLAGRPSERKGAVRLGTAAMGTVVAAGMAALALDGAPLLAAWAGPPARSPTTTLAVAFLGLAAVVAASQEIAAATLTVTGRTSWVTARALASGTVVNIAVSLLGARYVGIWAVAAATVLGNAVTAVQVWRGLSRSLSLEARDVGVALLPLGASLATAVAVGFALSGFAAGGALASALACVATTAAGCAVSLLVSAPGFVAMRGDA